ncbi:MAG: dTDP-4-dehydrorhamnose reductase [Alphaproteobacteria bacterium]|nr:dTDP-4-dehydrorhamnose reductase [Alphaproteobacteria bacterium]
MRILVAGAKGQVARSLALCGEAGPHELVLRGRPQLDLRDRDSLRYALDDVRPDLVINAAAYTAVDAAEADEAGAMAVNAQGAGELAQASAERGLPIIHFSTDYVFDGEMNRPYREDDAWAPINAYGRSKLAGEQAVQQANPTHLILRVAWVYSPFGRNFLKTMLGLAESRDAVSVVADQVGRPSYALDIARAVLNMCHQIEARPESAAWGLYNLSGPGAASWADFARAIFAESAARGGPYAHVNDVTSDEFVTPARRPANSRLDPGKLTRDWAITLPDWQAGVRDCLERLGGPGETWLERG